MPSNKIRRGLEEALAFARGDGKAARKTTVAVPAKIDVRRLRRRLKLTQAEFARRYGFTKSTLQNWEQGHRKPEGPARVLLTLIDRIPEAVEKALKAA